MKKLLGLIVLSLVLTQSAYADYDAAYSTLQKQDFPSAYLLMKQAADSGDHQAWMAVGKMLLAGVGTEKNSVAALPWLEKAANAGNVEAMNMLVQLYFEGNQVPKNSDAAKLWAHRSAATGNMIGQYLVAEVDFLDPALNYRDASGKPDMQKYFALAKRPISERLLDQEEFSMLSKSAEQGYLPAQQMLIGTLIDKVGSNNRARLQELVRTTQKLPEQLRNKVNVVTELQKIGESYTTLTMYKDVTLTALQGVALRAKLDGVEFGNCKVQDVKLTKTGISRPLQNATYLPVQSKLLDNFYLISGQWQETWTYDACGKSISVPLEFQADGLGGAYFQTKTMMN